MMPGLAVLVVVTLSLGWVPAGECDITSAVGEDQVKLEESQVDPAKERSAAVERAKALVAKTLEVSPDHLALESAAPATWPDSSLGCPERDRMYAQVITRGYKVILKHDAQQHEVHVAGSRAVLCPAKK